MDRLRELQQKQTYIARVMTLEFSDDSMRQKYNVYKIGSSKRPFWRLVELSRDKYGSYYNESFEMCGTYPLNIENDLHQKLSSRRIHFGKASELFYLTTEELKDLMQSIGFKTHQII